MDGQWMQRYRYQAARIIIVRVSHDFENNKYLEVAKVTSSQVAINITANDGMTLSQQYSPNFLPLLRVLY